MTFRDVAYPRQQTLVELDGAFGHRDALDRWADLQRDLEAAMADQLTLRPGWAQVLEPCRLATLVATVLRARGWEGTGRSCGPGCGLDGPGPGLTDVGGSSHTYRPDPPTSRADSA